MQFTFDIITACINKAIETGNFPENSKMANVTPVFKKEDPLDKSNYRPVSILPLLSKVYERVIYIQLSEYSNNFLNEVLLVSVRLIVHSMRFSNCFNHDKNH